MLDCTTHTHTHTSGLPIFLSSSGEHSIKNNRSLPRNNNPNNESNTIHARTHARSHTRTCSLLSSLIHPAKTSTDAGNSDRCSR